MHLRHARWQKELACRPWARWLSRGVLVCVLQCISGTSPAGDSSPASTPTFVIARVTHPPTLEDFLEMKPNGALKGQLTKVEGFVQRLPKDGAPSSQRTEVYLGYDEKNLYAVFVCFDSEPEKIRARMEPREQIFSDDLVSLQLDTFRDQRRAYVFSANPLGIQADAIWTEGQGFDDSFDTVWSSRGQLTPSGYLVWIAIPFKSLRFPDRPRQSWGLLLNRDIPRLGEETFWPHYSIRVEGRLNQMTALEGLENISSGRNIQLIPYGTFRSFRTLDLRDPLQPRFERKRAEPGGGLDAKFVFRDALVLDVALNPDFSQVESDEPQVTVNTRFEVFFPEKRPFFLENANYFQTPINLVFTRRVANPQFGVRLTGKLGPYSFGALLADDRSPGKRAPPGSPFEGERARFGIVRVNRDVFRQSSLGFLFTNREFSGSFNRLGGIDGRFKLPENWVTTFQAVTSSTRFPDGTALAGPAYDFQLNRAGRSLKYKLGFNDRSPGFRTDTGFVSRPDIRRYSQLVDYCFRPERRGVVCWGPGARTEVIFDHNGTRLDFTQSSWFGIDFVRQTSLSLTYNAYRERVRPEDFPFLSGNRDFSKKRYDVSFKSSYFRWITLDGTVSWGSRVNFVPPPKEEPFLGNHSYARLELTFRPVSQFSIQNSYLLTRLTDRRSGASIFNNHILRSKWNWQFTRELSLRVILQYNSVLANPNFTALQTTKNFNADFLLTYLIHPGTALYVGYNSNLQNLDPGLVPATQGWLRTPDRFINDGRQLFVKVSYLLRF